MQTGPAILRELHRLSAKTTNLVGEQARNFIIFDRSVMAFSQQRELKDNAKAPAQALVYGTSVRIRIAGDARPA